MQWPTSRRTEWLESVRHAPDQCWTWPGTINGAGYGPHRRVYEQLVGPIPEGHELDHLCKNKLCVNPNHLEVVTHLENIRRGEKANRTHCVRGHLFDEVNTYIKPNGTRNCRECRSAAMKEYHERHRYGVATTTR